MRYFRQVLALIREEKLYSAMYIAGTALAIAFTMLIAEVYYVKVADKPLHFFIISAVVYIIILCTVLIGTIIPAVKIVRARITEALREE